MIKTALSGKVFLIFIFFLLACQVSCQDNMPGQDWAQWRGPDRSGTWYDGPDIQNLTAENITRRWAVKIGPGYSGPTVSEGRLYVMVYADGSEQVRCFNAGNGKEIWTYSYPVSYNVGYPTGPRTSVQIFDGKAYSFGTMGHLNCFNAETGKVLWQINTLEQYESRIPIWGFASNPILVNDNLILQVGGISGACLVAFHKDTGNEVWRSLEDEASYSAPILIPQAGKQVLVYWTGESISGLDPENGQVHWSIPFQPGNMIMNIATPVYDPPHLFLSGFFDGSYLVKLEQQTLAAELVYHRHGSSENKTDALHCCISTPLIQDGYIYGIDSYGETRCLNLLTGDRIWELLLGKFTPKGYVDLGRVKLIDPVKISPNPRNGVCWAHPAFVGNQIFVRSDEQLVCIQVNNP